ncbi:sensor domain-containing diguanylate cyclase/phosphohydrolase [Halanaerobacter jeridensis]|uniref:Diguanylate cyclase (GGDEF)-like protein/PAS domain S-box-containing protein n=1 Tax=Halanaerobacter jeridensis TaxID=706427 RepID=A0A938XSE3_9FIRM|nr:diguanylate cyclase [Halanaerobacter jeridensis]MBM7555431.1 diguanylate cyclase (GGDEF)-like protein/PAS domain S-box-containing protein [Halanaerobacter jeridensis]
MSEKQEEIFDLNLINDESFYTNLMQQIDMPVIAWDQNFIIKDWNEEASKLLGWNKEEALNKNLFKMIIADKEQSINITKLKKTITSHEHQIDYISLENKTGEEIITTWDNILINSNQTLQVISFIKNITKRQQRKNKIKYLNFHDKLTGLYNREYFQEELKRLDVERQLPLSILVGDVNGLKMVNDAFGYQAGNQLLKRIADILKKVCREEDIIARVGGDEFALLFPRTGRKDVERIQERIEWQCRNHKADPIIPSIALGTAVKTEKEQKVNKILTLAEDRMYKHKLVESNSFRNCIISSLEKSLLEKSEETENHNHRLKKYSLQIGQKLNLESDKLDELEILARLHDIGKIAIPDSILKKPGALNEEEWSKMKEHPEIGYRIAAASKDLAAIADKILSHHERWDGTGYPNGLAGEEIPLLSRIASVVDAYDAMTNDRVYRPAMDEAEAKEELINCAGTQFDPQIVDIFINQILENDVTAY